MCLEAINITNIRYADDTVLLAESASDLQELLDAVVTESEKKGLTISCKKTECLFVAKKGESPAFTLRAKDQKIRPVSSFSFLGSLIRRC